MKDCRDGVRGASIRAVGVLQGVQHVRYSALNVGQNHYL